MSSYFIKYFPLFASMTAPILTFPLIFGHLISLHLSLQYHLIPNMPKWKYIFPQKTHTHPQRHVN